MAYVPLTKGYEAVIDAADAAYIGRWNWYANVVDPLVYGRRERLVSDPEGTPKGVLLHIEIAGRVPGMEVDHWDGDGLNNRRSNLRHATHQENLRNQSSRKTDLPKGVFPEGRSFIAVIGVDSKPRRLGRFPTIELAKAAYDAEAVRVFGEFARIEPWPPAEGSMPRRLLLDGPA